MTQITTVSKKLGQRVRKIREDKGVTQEQLALNAGLNRAYIGYIERGERNPSTEVISKLAKALRVPIHELFK
ncbi:helix-turn-helix transcriptional regulator [Candidatus Daviesbacteria bacterium]|nr:helix-turn-helix transcriptional regulator [Candidatus Daviesbacteria bacterium]